MVQHVLFSLFCIFRRKRTSKRDPWIGGFYRFYVGMHEVTRSASIYCTGGII